MVESKLKLVSIESPYAGKTEEEIKRNIRYAKACLLDCLKRGEAPIASHLLYTQDGILDDNIPEERALGMEAGFVWNKHAEITIIYTDLGISKGMKEGVERAKKEGRPVEYRTLPGFEGLINETDQEDKTEIVLKKNPTLGDLQKYLRKICEKNKWDKDSYLVKYFLFSEEKGELTKAIRNKVGLYKEKGRNMQSDQKIQSNLEEEFADVLSLLIELASIFEVDLEKAFREKWKINEERAWE